MRILFLSCLLLFNHALFGEQTLPKYVNYINDYADVLSNDEEHYLNNELLMPFTDSTSVEIAVVIEKSLNGVDVFDRAMFIARGWKIGDAKLNNGILVYISIQDRKYHIVTAENTQGLLTDGVVGEIGRKELVPGLKKGDYFNGIRNTVYALALTVIDDFKGKTREKKKKEEFPYAVIPILFFILFYLIFTRRGGGGGFSRRGFYSPPVFFWGSGFGHGNSHGGFGGGFGGGSGGGFGGFGGGGGFNGGGAGGSW
jgi:uncharacterized protein